MDEEEAQIAGLYGEAVLKLLLRAGILDVKAVVAMADELDAGGELGADMAAHRLRLAALTYSAADLADSASEQRAQFLRAQMRERTAMIEKDR